MTVSKTGAPVCGADSADGGLGREAAAAGGELEGAQGVLVVDRGGAQAAHHQQGSVAGKGVLGGRGQSFRKVSTLKLDILVAYKLPIVVDQVTGS